MEQVFNNPKANPFQTSEVSHPISRLGELILEALSCRLQNLTNRVGEWLAPSFSA